MLETPQLTAVESRNAAVLPVRCTRDEIGELVGPGIQELMGAVFAQGLSPSGPLFAHYTSVDPDAFEFEIGVPISGSVEPAGRVRAGTQPGARQVVRAVYRGPYEKLHEAWGELHGWIRTKGHEPGGTCWECYVTGPESGSDPAEWETVLYQPLG